MVHAWCEEPLKRLCGSCERAARAAQAARTAATSSHGRLRRSAARVHTRDRIDHGGRRDPRRRAARSLERQGPRTATRHRRPRHGPRRRPRRRAHRRDHRAHHRRLPPAEPDPRRRRAGARCHRRRAHRRGQARRHVVRRARRARRPLFASGTSSSSRSSAPALAHARSPWPAARAGSARAPSPSTSRPRWPPQGHAVALIDADVYGPTVPLMMGLPAVPPETHDGKMIPPEAHGVKVVSMGFFLPDNEPVVWRGPMLGRAIEQFLGDVLWGSPDYLLIDLPPGTGDIALTVAQMIPGAELIIVTTPQEAAARTAIKAAKMAQMTKQRVLGRRREHGLLRVPGLRQPPLHLRPRRRLRDRPPHGHPAAGPHPAGRGHARGRRQRLPAALDPSTPVGAAFADIARALDDDETAPTSPLDAATETFSRSGLSKTSRHQPSPIFLVGAGSSARPRRRCGPSWLIARPDGTSPSAAQADCVSFESPRLSSNAQPPRRTRRPYRPASLTTFPQFLSPRLHPGRIPGQNWGTSERPATHSPFHICA